MKWFTEVFLPSLESRMNNPKYPNSCILSDKQADICYKYMEEISCRGDYGYFNIYQIKVNGHKWTMTQRGRYTFLTKA